METLSKETEVVLLVQLEVRARVVEVQIYLEAAFQIILRVEVSIQSK
jgi:hypothetical protein